MTALSIEAHRAEHDSRARYPVQGLYVERFWLPALGPTATLALRLLDQMLDSSGGQPVGQRLVEFAPMLGVTHPAKMRNAIERLAMAFVELHEAAATYIVLVPRMLSPVPVKHRPKWPAGLAALHDVAAEIFAEPLNIDERASMGRP